MTQYVTRIDDSKPVFLVQREGRRMLYAPGHGVEIDAYEPLPFDLRSLQGRGSSVWRQSERAQHAWEAMLDAPFEPECLTIYLSNQCNLACHYCFAAPRVERDDALVSLRSTGSGDGTISPECVEQAANFVAKFCSRKGKPLTVVFHGGGEPTLHWQLLKELAAITRRIAEVHQIPWWSYLATHGALSDDKSKWLAANISHIGLSCDGPPAIQNRQRPTAKGRATADCVERFASVLRDHAKDFTVRATITRLSVERQSAIVRYAKDVLGTNSIRFEPVYAPYHWGETSFVPDDAEHFVRHFLNAKALARSLGCSLELSGTRPDEVHGPYCNVLRDVLQLTPDGNATACFLSSGGEDDTDRKMIIGRVDAASGRFVCDQARIREIRREALRIPKRCWQCVNIYHCSRDCPEVCPVVGGEDSRAEGGFRCRVLKRLSEHWLWESRDETSPMVTRDGNLMRHNHSTG